MRHGPAPGVFFCGNRKAGGNPITGTPMSLTAFAPIGDLLVTLLRRKRLFRAILADNLDL